MALLGDPLVFVPQSRPDQGELTPPNIIKLGEQANTQQQPQTNYSNINSLQTQHNTYITPPPTKNNHTHLFPPQQVQLKWKDVAPVKTTLKNLGNTCFMNSVLQCLSYLPPLVDLCGRRLHSSTCNRESFCVVCEFEKHVCDIHTKGLRTIAPHRMMKGLVSLSRDFQPGRQQDALDYYLALVQRLHQASLDAGHSEGFTITPETSTTTAIHQIFGGRLRSKTECIACGSSSTAKESFFYLSLECGRKRSASVAAALKQYLSPDRSARDKRGSCSHCGELVDSRASHRIESSPHVLVLHLRRTDRINGVKSGKFLIDDVIKLGESSNDDKEGFVDKYKLIGVIVHSGVSLRSGHYRCYVLSSADIWYHLDDERIEQVSMNRLQSDAVYMLFYLRQATSDTANVTACEKEPTSNKDEHWVPAMNVPSARDFDTESSNSSNDSKMLPHDPVPDPVPSGQPGQPVSLQALRNVSTWEDLPESAIARASSLKKKYAKSNVGATRGFKRRKYDALDAEVDQGRKNKIRRREERLIAAAEPQKVQGRRRKNPRI